MTKCSDLIPNGLGEPCNLDGLALRCGGTGVLICRCGGDLCVCGFHGEEECFGCEDCEGYEDDGGADAWMSERDREATDAELARAESAWENRRTREPI